MNKYEENMELIKNAGFDPLFYLDTEYFENNTVEDIALSEVARAYNYSQYIKHLLDITDEEFKQEVEKQLQETYSKLICNKK